MKWRAQGPLTLAGFVDARRASVFISFELRQERGVIIAPSRLMKFLGIGSKGRRLRLAPGYCISHFQRDEDEPSLTVGLLPRSLFPRLSVRLRPLPDFPLVGSCFSSSESTPKSA
jgi:hypothetical protein